MTISEWKTLEFAPLEGELGFPSVITLARQGSSVGEIKVSGTQEFTPVLAEGFRRSRDLLAEEFLAARWLDSVETGGEHDTCLARQIAHRI